MSATEEFDCCIYSIFVRMILSCLGASSAGPGVDAKKRHGKQNAASFSLEYFIYGYHLLLKEFFFPHTVFEAESADQLVELETHGGPQLYPLVYIY